MTKVLGGILLLAISSTAWAASTSTLTSLPTRSDADILTEQLQGAVPLTTQKMRELFEKSPNFTATCFPSDKAFAPVPPSDEKVKSPDTIWSEYSDDFNLPSKISPAEPLSGHVSFVYKPAGKFAFDLSAYVSLKVADTDVKYLLAAPSHVICQFNNAALCNALIGGFSASDLKLDEVFSTSTIKENQFVSVSSKGQFGIYLASNELIMRIASKLTAMKPGEHSWNNNVEANKYIVRYLCTLTPSTN